MTEDTEALLVNPAMYTATIEETEAAEVYKTTKLSLKIEQINKYDAKGIDFNTVECILKSQVNPRIAIKCNVHKVEDDEYCIQFTPTFRGRCQLVVVINGEEVTGSPFPVFVSIIQPIIKLKEPIKTMNASIYGECDLAFNSLGEIITISFGNKIEVRDKDSKILRSVMCSDSDYGLCNGFLKVAVDSTNNIYILAVNSRYSCDGRQIPMILKLNKMLELVGTTRLKSAAGVAVVDDRVLACSSGSIDIYTTDLEHVGQIISPDHGSPGYFGEVRDISSDKTGNPYILAPFQESSGLNVVVFSSSGEYLHSLEVQQSLLPTPYNNCCMCVAGKYVYIASSTSDDTMKVYVHTTDGEYISTIQCHLGNTWLENCILMRKVILMSYLILKFMYFSESF